MIVLIGDLDFIVIELHLVDKLLWYLKTVRFIQDNKFILCILGSPVYI